MNAGWDNWLKIVNNAKSSVLYACTSNNKLDIKENSIIVMKMKGYDKEGKYIEWRSCCLY